MNKSFKEFFSFSKKELNGLLVFCFLLVSVALAPFVYSFFTPAQVYDYTAFENEIIAFKASASKKEGTGYKFLPKDDVEAEKATGELFPFNPNNLPASTWERLGLSAKQIRVIKNYESKGGRFYKKDDLKKIYSIKPNEYARLEPFIDIPEKTNAYKATYNKSAGSKPEIRHPIVIEVNSADSAQLESLNGIGPAFASRIIKYRNRLGGFYSKEQLLEVYGLDSALYRKLINQIEVHAASVRQIPVNSATFDDLKKHPYLTYKQMNAIVQYRKQHGNFKDIQDMKAIAILNDDILRKIAPYFSFSHR